MPQAFAALIVSVVPIVMAVGLTIWCHWFVRTLVTAKAPFYLDLAELSLELSTGLRHARWGEVYSVWSDPAKPGPAAGAVAGWHGLRGAPG